MKPFILELLIQRGCKRKGYGSTLVKYAAQLVGGTTLGLIARKRVLKFYEKLGFRTSKHSQIFEPNNGELYLAAIASSLADAAVKDALVIMFSSRAEFEAEAAPWFKAYQAALCVQHRDPRVDLQPEHATYLVCVPQARV